MYKWRHLWLIFNAESSPDDPLRILGEFLLEKHREIVAKESEAGQMKTDGADS